MIWLEMKRLGSWSVVALVLVVAGCGSSHDAARQGARPGIGLDHRIGPVSFAEPKPQVTKALGRSVVARLSGHPLRFYAKVNPLRFYAKVRIYVGYPPNPPKGKPRVAAFIVTRSARYKTRSGVGVGSPLRELRHRVRVRCHGGVCRHERANFNFNLPSTVFDIDPTTKRISEIAIVPGAATGRCEPTSGFCVRGAAANLGGNRGAATGRDVPRSRRPNLLSGPVE